MGYKIASLKVILSSLIAPLFLFVLENHKNQGKLTFWYWIYREINSFVYYGGIIIFPYVIAKWVSNRIGIVLFVLIMVIDGIWRIFWYMYNDKWINEKKIYSGVWSGYDSIQVYLLVPFIVWIIMHKYPVKRVSSRTSYQTFNDESSILENKQRNDIELPESNKNEESSKTPTSIYVLYFVLVGMFLGWSVFDYYVRFQRESTELMIEKIVKLIPIFVLCGVLLRKKHSRDFIFICWFVILQNMLIDWGIFYKTATFIIGNSIPLSGFIVLLLQSIYFQFLKFVGDKIIGLSSPSGEVYELKFIYMLYYNYVSTLLCGITLYSHNIFQFILMLLTKLLFKWLQFDQTMHILKKKLKACISSSDDVDGAQQNLYASEYIYAIISNWTMYPSIIFMILVDYYQNNVWFVNGTKTIDNLRFAILTIGIILIFDVFVNSMIYCCNKREYYTSQQLSRVNIPVYYFFCVCIFCQILSINVARNWYTFNQ